VSAALKVPSSTLTFRPAARFQRSDHIRAIRLGAPPPAWKKSLLAAKRIELFERGAHLAGFAEKRVGRSVVVVGVGGSVDITTEARPRRTWMR
jgi:hypothetical protein